MALIVKFYSTVSSNLNQIPQSDGQIIFAKDTQVMYLDDEGIRLPYNVIKVFKQDSFREALINPAEGFYFVEETAVLWRYKNKWKQLTPDNLQQVIIGKTLDDFDSLGNPSSLYVTDNGIYKWDELLKEYRVVSNVTKWKNIGDNKWLKI